MNKCLRLLSSDCAAPQRCSEFASWPQRWRFLWSSWSFPIPAASWQTWDWGETRPCVHPSGPWDARTDRDLWERELIVWRHPPGEMMKRCVLCPPTSKSVEQLQSLNHRLSRRRLKNNNTFSFLQSESLVQCHFEYVCSLWMIDLCQTWILEMQQAQNRMVTLVLGLTSISHVENWNLKITLNLISLGLIQDTVIVLQYYRTLIIGY